MTSAGAQTRRRKIRPGVSRSLRATADLFTATASASDCACRGSRRLRQSDAPEPRRIFRRGTAALPHGDGSGRPQGIAMDALRLPQPCPRPPARNAPQAPGVCCVTMPALPANPHSPLVSRRPVASRFLKQPRPDLFPGMTSVGFCSCRAMR